MLVSWLDFMLSPSPFTWAIFVTRRGSCLRFPRTSCQFTLCFSAAKNSSATATISNQQHSCQNPLAWTA